MPLWLERWIKYPFYAYHVAIARENTHMGSNRSKDKRFPAQRESAGKGGVLAGKEHREWSGRFWALGSSPLLDLAGGCVSVQDRVIH